MSHSLALLAVCWPRLRSSSLLVSHLSGCALSCSWLHRPVCVPSSIPYRCVWFLVSVLRKDSRSRFVPALIRSIHLVCFHLAVIMMPHSSLSLSCSLCMPVWTLITIGLSLHFSHRNVCTSTCVVCWHHCCCLMLHADVGRRLSMILAPSVQSC